MELNEGFQAEENFLRDVEESLLTNMQQIATSHKSPMLATVAAFVVSIAEITGSMVRMRGMTAIDSELFLASIIAGVRSGFQIGFSEDEEKDGDEIIN